MNTLLDKLYYFFRFSLPESTIKKLTDICLFFVVLLNRNKDRWLYRRLYYLAETYNPDIEKTKELEDECLWFEW